MWDDFSEALVYIGESQIPSQVPVLRPMAESHILAAHLPVNEGAVASLVARVSTKVEARMTTIRKTKVKNPWAVWLSLFMAFGFWLTSHKSI
jgi:hypothetical protein